MFPFLPSPPTYTPYCEQLNGQLFLQDFIWKSMAVNIHGLFLPLWDPSKPKRHPCLTSNLLNIIMISQHTYHFRHGGTNPIQSPVEWCLTTIPALQIDILGPSRSLQTYTAQPVNSGSSTSPAPWSTDILVVVVFVFFCTGDRTQGYEPATWYVPTEIHPQPSFIHSFIHAFYLRQDLTKLLRLAITHNRPRLVSNI